MPLFPARHTGRSLAWLLITGTLLLSCGSPEPLAPGGPPRVSMGAPAAGTVFQGGVALQYAGSAVDADGATLPGSALVWRVERHDAAGVQVVLPETAGASGSIPVPSTGAAPEDFYRFVLRATDGEGRRDSVRRDVPASVIQVTVATAPSGRQVTWNGQSHAAPFTATQVAGMDATVGTTTPQTSVDTTFAFQAWSDGGALTHPVSPTTSGTITATFGISVAVRRPPTPVIATPLAGALYRGGVAIPYGGSATDNEGDAIVSGSLRWWADYHHDGVVERVLAPTAGATGNFTPSPTGSVSPAAFYRLFLSATDDRGLVDTVSRDIAAQIVQLNVSTTPAGRTVTLDGQNQASPLSVTTVVGVQRTIGVPSPQVVGTTTYTFLNWSDGGAQSHAIAPPAGNASYTAAFSVTTPPRNPPTPVMATPAVGTLYQGGQVIAFSGSATDNEGDAIAPGSLSWWVDFHHDGVVDPFLAPVTGASGNFTVASSGSPSPTAFYRLYLRAVDDQGLVDTLSRDLSPRTTQLTLATVPGGRTVVLDGVQGTAPLTVTTAVGVRRTIATVATQVSGDTSFTFASWSDAGAVSHVVSPPTANIAYTATFTVTVPPRLPPVATITTPVAGTRWRGSQAVVFSGAATDADGNAVTSGGLSWWAEFHHDGQVDQVLPLTGGASGSFTPSPTGTTSPTAFYRLYLRAVDNQGLVDTVFRDLAAETVQLTLASAPAGRSLTLDGQAFTAPLTVTAIAGMQRTITAPSPQATLDTTYAFQGWSDAGSQSHVLIVPAANATVTATYSATPIPPPVVTIATPLVGSTYHGGSVIQVSGTAVDGTGAPLSGSALSWWADFHHDSHTHPFVPVTAGATASVTIPTSGEVSANVWYRFYVRAVDARGRADTLFVDVFPETVQLTLTSVPTGRTLTLDGQPQVAPFAVIGVVGIQRQIGTTSPQSAGDSTYTFQAWSDAGAQTHAIATPAVNTTYTASFVATGPANKPPTVSLTAPANASSWVVNTAVTVSATAADSDGTIQQVQFFDGATAIGTDNAAPYSITWTPTVTGSHALTARATDNSAATTTSAPVTVTVINGGTGDTQDPTLTLSTPGDGEQGVSGTISASASANDNVGVVEVEFQLDGVTLVRDSTFPWAAALGNTANFTSGVHQVRARARDAAGNTSPWDVARVTFAGSVTRPLGFIVAPFAGTISGQATAMAFAPDGRLFVADQGGDLRVIKNGSLLPAPFVHVNTTADGERGLLGVTFDPQFGTNNQFVYVHYTVTSGGVSHNRVSRFTANGDVAVANSEFVVVDLPALSTATNHNGGAIHFGPDGKLYVAVGDNNTGSNAQSTTSLFGKVLRYNPDGSIPADNPALGSGSNQAIWAMGFRNPFTFGFQPGTGRLFINDVGESTWEEINEGLAGANYGWPTSEGVTTNPAFTSPLFTYKHGDKPPAPPSLVTGEAVVGAAFYNPGTVLFPADYVGDYFFADYVEGWINRLDLAAGNGAVYSFVQLPNIITDLAVGPDGALYALAVQSNGSWGVTRISR